jgi:hypothetical protein
MSSMASGDTQCRLLSGHLQFDNEAALSLGKAQAGLKAQANERRQWYETLRYSGDIEVLNWPKVIQSPCLNQNSYLI